MPSVALQVALAAQAFFLAIVLLISSCANSPDKAQPLPALGVAEHEAKLEAFDPWRASGSIALESAQQGKFNATFSWDANRSGFDIKLFGPLGVQAAQLLQDASGARLIQRDGDTITGTAEALLLQATGFPVPINKMQKWVVGLPGDAQRVKRDDINRLESMVVQESDFAWDVEYSRYSITEGLHLPKVVLINGDGVKIQLSIKKWSKTTDRPDSNRLSIPGVSA